MNIRYASMGVFIALTIFFLGCTKPNTIDWDKLFPDKDQVNDNMSVSDDEEEVDEDESVDDLDKDTGKSDDGASVDNESEPDDDAQGSNDDALIAEEDALLADEVIESDDDDTVFVLDIDPVDETSPWIANTAPAADATNVPVDVVIAVTFSEVIESDTVSTENLLLEKTGGLSVPLTVTYRSIDHAALLTPIAPLDHGTQYAVTVTTNITDLAGNPLEEEKVFSFVTTLCGNGIEDFGEQCDDGNANDDDACTNACKRAVCGDGIRRNSYVYEEEILRLNLDEGTGATVYDTSGDENHGIVNGASWDAAGYLGNALYFDGIDDYLQWNYADTPTNDFTMAAWVKPVASHEIDSESTSGTTGSSGQKYVFVPEHKAANAGAGVSVGTNGISVYEHGETYMPAIAVYSGTISSAEWTHMVVTYTAKQPRIYVNGVLVRTGLISPRPTVYPPSRLGGGDYGFFNGRIDRVRVYDRALTAQEIASGALDGFEQCDDGNTNDDDECANDCRLPSCGDGDLDLYEECDDSNAISLDGCDVHCREFPYNDAVFVSQNVQSTMQAGTIYEVSVTFQNTGNTTWATSEKYHLGSQNPQDNTTWGFMRVGWGTDEVQPGESKTFSFNVTAPGTPGTYNFQWKMVRDTYEWFGMQSTNVPVTVN